MSSRVTAFADRSVFATRSLLPLPGRDRCCLISDPCPRFGYSWSWCPPPSRPAPSLSCAVLIAAWFCRLIVLDDWEPCRFPSSSRSLLSEVTDCISVASTFSPQEAANARTSVSVRFPQHNELSQGKRNICNSSFTALALVDADCPARVSEGVIVGKTEHESFQEPSDRCLHPAPPICHPASC